MTRLFCSLALCLTLTTALLAQDKSDDPPKATGSNNGAQPGGGTGRAPQPPITRRSREERVRYANRTPEERQKEQYRRMLDRATEMYQLDDAQQIMAGAEIKAMQDQRRAAMGPEADEYDQLQKKMGEVLSRAGPAGPTTQSNRETQRELRNNPELRQMRTRMREIESKHPFDWEAVIKRIEAQLPPEQAAKGHALWEQSRLSDRNRPDRFPRFRREEADRENRRRERAQRMAERDGPATPPQAQSGPQPTKDSPSPTPPPRQSPGTPPLGNLHQEIHRRPRTDRRTVQFRAGHPQGHAHPC